MELPHRTDRSIEESKNPLHPLQQNEKNRDDVSSFFPFSWGMPSFSSSDSQQIELKQSKEVQEDRKSIIGRMSLQGMSLHGDVSTGKSVQEHVLYTSYSVYFNYEIFVKEFIVNMFHPFFTFWVDPYMHSFNNWSNPLSILYLHGIPVLTVLIVISAYLS